MKIELVATKCPGTIGLDRLPAVVGGTTEQDVYATHPGQGAFHCLISRGHDDLVVWDLSTEGGTFVNGVRVTRALLRPGDTLKLGENEFTVKGEDRPRHYLHGVRS